MSHPRLSDVRASLKNSGEDTVFLDPRATIPFAYIDRLDSSGSWIEFGSPMRCVDECPPVDDARLRVMPTATRRLRVPYEDAIAIYEAEVQYVKQLRLLRQWEETEGRSPSTDSPLPHPPPDPFPGTFRLRVRYAKTPWPVSSETPAVVFEVVSEGFSIESSGAG